jgi:hypothetical protein
MTETSCTLRLPAHYTVPQAEELVYLDGGALTETTLILAGVGAALLLPAVFCLRGWESTRETISAEIDACITAYQVTYPKASKKTAQQEGKAYYQQTERGQQMSATATRYLQFSGLFLLGACGTLAAAVLNGKNELAAE